jgi:DNA-binding Lrp family transcriptional regulator
MVTAIVLMKIERNLVNTVSAELTDIAGVSEVYSVAGKYDLAVIVRVEDNDRLASIVTDKMLKIEGIIDSETLISFRVYSKHDLENMFSLSDK